MKMLTIVYAGLIWGSFQAVDLINLMLPFILR